MKAAVIAALALISATGVRAQEAQPAPDAKAEKKICRTERVTGSLTRTNRICMTRAEWDNLAAQTRKGMDEISRQAGQAPREQSPLGGM